MKSLFLKFCLIFLVGCQTIENKPLNILVEHKIDYSTKIVLHKSKTTEIFIDTIFNSKRIIIGFSNNDSIKNLKNIGSNDTAKLNRLGSSLFFYYYDNKKPTIKATVWDGFDKDTIGGLLVNGKEKNIYFLNDTTLLFSTLTYPAFGLSGIIIDNGKIRFLSFLSTKYCSYIGCIHSIESFSTFKLKDNIINVEHEKAKFKIDKNFICVNY